MKKAREWFNKLPYPENEKATINAGEAANWLFGNLMDALYQSFIWGKSPEGREYWEQVVSKHRRLISKKK